MEAMSFNLVAMDRSSLQKGQASEDAMGFSKVLNEFTKDLVKEEVKEVENKVEDLEDKSLAYLVDNPMLAMIKFVDYTDMEVDVNVDNMDKINGQILGSEILNFNDKTMGEISTNLSVENLDEILIETQDGLSKDMEVSNDLYTAISDKVNTTNEPDLKEIDKKDYGKIDEKDLGDKGLINLKDNNIKEKPILQKDSIKVDLERYFNPETDTEEINLNSKVENILEPEEKLSSKKEDLEIKAFSMDDLQNSLRKIDIKHIDSKEIKPPVLSQENMDIFNDSIIELIQLREEGDASIMNVKLIPRELGSIDISLKMEQGKIVAKIFVENEEMKQLFASSVKSLSQNLQRQDIAIEEIQIDLGTNSDNASNNQENRGQERPFRRKNLGFEERDSFKERPIESTDMIQDGVSILV